MSCFANAVTPQMRTNSPSVTTWALGHPSINPKDKHSLPTLHLAPPAFALPERMVHSDPEAGGLGRSGMSLTLDKGLCPQTTLHWPSRNQTLASL